MGELLIIYNCIFNFVFKKLLIVFNKIELGFLYVIIVVVILYILF